MAKVIAASEEGRLFVFPAVVEATFDEVKASATFFAFIRPFSILIPLYRAGSD
jgi:hypothetical protein